MKTNIRCSFVWLLVITSTSFAAGVTSFRVQSFHRDANGVTFQVNPGAMRIEVCSDRVIHVISTPTAQIPEPKVPVFTQSCNAQSFEVKEKRTDVSIITRSIRVHVNRKTGALRFLSSDGSVVLAEPDGGGKSVTTKSAIDSKTCVSSGNSDPPNFGNSEPPSDRHKR